MIDNEKLEEVERQAERWASAYSIIDEKSKELCVIDIKRAKIAEEITKEESNKDRCQDIINKIIEEYDDEDSETAIKKIIDKYISPVVTIGMIEQ